MKKIKKIVSKRATKQPQSHTGIALLVCFFLASIAVAIAMRQLILERRFREQTTSLKKMTNPLVGVYKVTIPAGKSAGRVITLELDDKRNAVLTQDHRDDKQPIVQKGSWSGDSNGTVIVTFDNTAYAFSFNPAGSGSLRLLNPDVKVWGAATLTLNKE